VGIRRVGSTFRRLSRGSRNIGVSLVWSLNRQDLPTPIVQLECRVGLVLREALRGIYSPHCTSWLLLLSAHGIITIGWMGGQNGFETSRPATSTTTQRALSLVTVSSYGGNKRLVSFSSHFSFADTCWVGAFCLLGWRDRQLDTSRHCVDCPFVFVLCTGRSCRRWC
jgi:hypothetical protein